MPTTHKLRIGVDIDAVLYPYIPQLRHFAVTTLKRPAQQFPDPRSWDFAAAWDLTGTQLRTLMHAGVDQGTVLTGAAPLTGAVPALGQLLAAGHTVHLVTDRAALGEIPGRAVRQTRAWLRAHAVPYTSLTFAGDKTCVATDIFVEDKPTNIDALVEAGVDTYVVDYPYNRHVQVRTGRRVPSFAAAAAHILSR